VQLEEKSGLLYVQAPSQPKIVVHGVATDDFYTTLFNTSCSEEFLVAFKSTYTIPANAKSEEEIFTANILAFIHPAQREHAGILQQAANNTLSQLIQPSDIKSIIHSHSNWSDGMNTIADMAKACIDKGYEYLVLSDHSQSAYYANGLTPERITKQHIEIDELNAKLSPFKIFKSIEADILGDGNLDYTPDVLKTFDLVIASVHSNLKMTQEKAMDRVLTAIRNPYTTILGHPTGRLLLSREGYPLDHKVIIDECVKHNVVIEINAHPRRLDLDWTWIEYALEKGALLSIDPDAHVLGGYDDVYFGIMAAQKGGLTAKHNLSSFTLKEFEEFLKRKIR
jgi:DNA polymerase (family 10)